MTAVEITCRTCYRQLTCPADVVRCFANEHELPGSSDLPDGVPADVVTAKLHAAIALCEAIRQGKLSYRDEVDSEKLAQGAGSRWGRSKRDR